LQYFKSVHFPKQHLSVELYIKRKGISFDKPSFLNSKRITPVGKCSFIWAALRASSETRGDQFDGSRVYVNKWKQICAALNIHYVNPARLKAPVESSMLGQYDQCAYVPLIV